MSIFNVGTGREPAEIGVAEYQKPDYQQFEKLANVNMHLKQAELEKAQKKTKEWGDILNTDFSTKYAVEQSQYVQKNIQSIKDDLMKDVSKNPDLLNDPTTIMQVKARLNQIKGYVKTLDEQAENIIKQKSEFEKDTKGIAYDKQYGKEYFEAQDNPIEFYKKNPDSEVGKTLGVIINSPQIQAITDPDQKRFAIRASLQSLPMKQGTIATDTTPDLTLKFDDVDAKSKDGTSSGYSEVSRPNRISSLMGHVVGKSDPTANKTYVEIWKDKVEHKTGGNYNQYLEQVRSDYANDIAEMTKDYTGKDEQLEMIKKMPDPATATEEDLIRYDYARNYETQFRSRQERASSPKINVYNNTGGGNKDKQSGVTSRQVLKLSNNFTTSGVVTTMQPKDENKQIDTDIVYGVTDLGVPTRITSKGGATGVKSKMKDARTTLVMVNKNTGQIISEAQKQEILKNPSKYGSDIIWKTGISIEQEVQNADGSSKKQMGLAWGADNTTAMAQLVDEYENGNYDKSNLWMPASQYDNTFTLDEGISIENGDNSIRRSSVYGAKKKPVKTIVKKK